ncbi:MAG: hypothetical protein J6Q58_02360, partial [Clostridia bacterium]|nr:hypothetical protein [Clostridia bacterium]
DVTIYDRCSVSGGNLTAWKRKGHVIDNCIHWFTGTNPNSIYYKKWVEIGAITENGVSKSNYLYKSVLNGESICLYRDIDKTKEEMLNVSIEDKKEINFLINAIKNMAYFMGTGGKNCNEKIDFTKLITFTPAFIRYYNLSLNDLAKKFTHPLLKRFLTDYIEGSFGVLSFIVTAATFCFNNGDIPVGSSKQTAKNITDRFLSLGGKLVLNETAVKAYYDGKKVAKLQFESGLTAYADYFIFTGDAFNIFYNILKKSMPSTLNKRFLNAKYERFSSIHTAFSVDLNDLPFKNSVAVDVASEYVNTLKEDRLKLREYSHDLTLAPLGKTVIQSISFCPQARSRHIINISKDKAKYNEFKTNYDNAVLRCIEKEFPTLKGKLTFLDCWTPYTYKRYTGATLGEYMSFSYPKKHFAMPIKNTVKGVKNVVIGSQWLTVPGGLPNALQMGLDASKTIAYFIKRDEKLNKLILPSSKAFKA